MPSLWCNGTIQTVGTSQRNSCSGPDAKVFGENSCPHVDSSCCQGLVCVTHLAFWAVHRPLIPVSFISSVYIFQAFTFSHLYSKQNSLLNIRWSLYYAINSLPLPDSRFVFFFVFFFNLSSFLLLVASVSILLQKQLLSSEFSLIASSSLHPFPDPFLEMWYRLFLLFFLLLSWSTKPVLASISLLLNQRHL